ncbi:leucine-rich repeat protein [Butyrivibrio sp. LC3010]|uniref:leucine-rich repeat protein n=1 Tax=Butyrivibrio sp. LC3010 TaxID=1280680 RepID=UPI000412B16B|nr:leucine-rich repeat protein [Butyrivibrio sp. LC3010]
MKREVIIGGAVSMLFSMAVITGVLPIPKGEPVIQVYADYYDGTVTVDGTKYRILSKETMTAEIVRFDADKIPQTGDLVCPEKVNIEDENYAITSVGAGAFSGLKIKGITLQDGLKTIGSGAFANCSELEEVVIPDSVTNIDSCAFTSCKALTKVTLPKELGYISNGLFSDCSSLSSIQIPESVKRIDGGAFSNCTSLKSIKFRKGVEFNWNIITGCSALEYAELYVGDYFQYAPFFNGCTSLKDVTIHGTGKTTLDYVYNRTPLVSLTIDGIQKIGRGCFAGCATLETVKITDNSLTTLEEAAFNGCSSLKKIDFPASLTTLPDTAFAGCESLEPIDLTHFTEIGNAVFSGCWIDGNPTDGTPVDITFSKNIKKIGSGVFGGSKLGTVNIESNALNSMTPGTFYNAKIKHLKIIGDGISSVIPDYAFESVESLDEVEITDVVTIGKFAFFSEEKKPVEDPDPSTSGSGDFIIFNPSVYYGCCSIEKLVLSGNISEIDESAFEGPKKLNEVIVPKSVRKVGKDAFKDCSPAIYYYAENKYTNTDSWGGSEGALKAFVKVNTENENGTIKVSGTSSAAIAGNNYYLSGDTVTISADPDKGYILDYLTVTDDDGNEVDVKNNSFVMPNLDVKVSAAYKRELSDNMILDIAPQTYNNGREITPEVIVKDGEITLKKDEDYTVSYTDNIDAGTGKVIITAKGNYSGSVTKSFDINTVDPMVTAPTAITELKANGQPLTLVNPGTVIGGTIIYSLDKENWSEAVPSAAEAGEYKVWYKVLSDKNHNGTEPSYVEVSISTEETASENTEPESGSEEPATGTGEIESQNNEPESGTEESGNQNNTPSSEAEIPSADSGEAVNRNENISAENGEASAGRNETVAPNTEASSEREVTSQSHEEVTRIEEATPAANGTVLKDTNSNAEYIVTSSAIEDASVEYKANILADSKNIAIPQTVDIDGTTYKVTSIADNAFKDNKTVKTVTMSDSIEEIGDNAFDGCTALKSVKVGSNVTKIGDKAFSDCSKLKKVVLPQNLTTLGDKVFKGSSVKKVEIKSKKLNKSGLSKNTFKGLRSDATVKVPKSKKKAYSKLFVKKGLSKNTKVK